MDIIESELEIPEALVADFASDPTSPYDKVLLQSNDVSWPLFKTLNDFLDGLPRTAIESAYSDRFFISIYGPDERLARVWFTQNLLIQEVSRRRLRLLAEMDTVAIPSPYSAEALYGLQVDDEQMVRLSDFKYNGATLQLGGFSFVTCLTNHGFNSTYWLQQALYSQEFSDHVRVRLDPLLWGRSDRFPSMAYRMLVYATPLDWKSIADLRVTHHGQMRPDDPGSDTELTEFCWTPRDDGIHFICEELPRRDLIAVRASRYLHAIYDPSKCSIIHFDGALRIYTDQQIEVRLREHLRNAGKCGIRRKIFRLEAPIDRDAFSLIAQAFFIWNSDLYTYFRKTLSQSE